MSDNLTFSKSFSEEPLMIEKSTNSTVYLDTFRNANGMKLLACVKIMSNFSFNIKSICKEIFFSNGGKYLLKSNDMKYDEEKKCN